MSVADHLSVNMKPVPTQGQRTISLNYSRRLLAESAESRRTQSIGLKNPRTTPDFPGKMVFGIQNLGFSSASSAAWRLCERYFRNKLAHMVPGTGTA